MEDFQYCSTCDNYVYIDDYNEHLDTCLYNSLMNYFSNHNLNPLDTNINQNNIFSNIYNVDLTNNNISENITELFNNVSNDVSNFINQNINSQENNQTNQSYTINDLNKKFPIMNCLEKTECIICLTDKIKKCRELSCNHIFCNECIDKWFLQSNSCPICKKNIL